MKNVLLGMMLFATMAVAADAPKVPSDIGVRIRNVQLDVSRVQTQQAQIQLQYEANQQLLAHDQSEIDSLKKEALDAAKLDPAKNDVDVEKLVFITRPEVKK